MRLMLRGICIWLSYLLFLPTLVGQKTGRFDEEIANYTRLDQLKTISRPILFTGSSTIRMWTALPEDFPRYPVLNRGFGGSTTADLLFYYPELIKKYRASKIFIYEGDNDIAAGATVDTIIYHYILLLNKIRKEQRRCLVYVISPKPSPSRWSLREKYEALNAKLKSLTNNYKRVTFVDMWSPMLDGQGQPQPELFLSDQLHMNRKGYLIWKKILQQYLPS